MPDTGWQLLTGSGSASLSGGSQVTILDFNFKINSVATVRVRQPTPGLGQRYRFAGSVGLSQFIPDNTGSSVDQVAWAHPITYAVETNTYLLNIPADKYWWVLPVGLGLYVFFDW